MGTWDGIVRIGRVRGFEETMRGRGVVGGERGGTSARAALLFGEALLLAGAVLLAGALLVPGTGVTAQTPTTSELEAFRPRSIGPAVTGGRIHDVEVLPHDPSTVYVATASGGLWKSENHGHTWRDVFEGMPVSSFGDLAIAPSDPDILYAGTGEQQNRQSSTWGDGVYRSADGGETWRHLGLEATRHIGRVVVHPDDPDVAWVAAAGNLWRGSEERGVYRTTDGGRSWERVLPGPNPWTGAIDLVIDPSDPDVLYAALYQRLRRAWGFNGGGPGSGIWKSVDGGRTWRELRDGIPQGDKGRIGLAISRTNPRVLNATVEHAERGGTYRSEDGGETWQRMSDRNPRPMYYSHIAIDPTEDRVVYILSTSIYRSRDGGASWEDVSARPTYDVGVHADHHAIWIDPSDPEHFFLAGDAGLYETYDGGTHYRKINNVPIGQFYAVGVDMEEPYNVYGGTQDNHSWRGPSANRRWIGIVNDDWVQTGFGDGMYQQVDLHGPATVYVGSQNGGVSRVDARTGASLSISPRAPEGEAYRFDWTAPMRASAHTPGLLYLGGNRLFISRDRGGTWERTADLTRAVDRDTLALMGVPGSEISLSRNDGTSSYSEITAIAESPVDADVLWIGTDDGVVRLSRDGGGTWADVSAAIPGPGDAVVSEILASRSGTDVAWVALDAHRSGDFAPYLFRTDDGGGSWTPMHRGLPESSVLSLAEHPDDPRVLFLGTEHHLWITADGGAGWSRMPHFPTTAYDDLVIHPRERDLVAATHGRSLWILDDTRSLTELLRPSEPAVRIATVAPATLFHYRKSTSYRGQAEFAGENPPEGALIAYRLGGGGMEPSNSTARGEAFLRVVSPNGETVREMVVPAEPGIHRVSWDLRRSPPEGADRWRPRAAADLPHPVDRRGPLVAPGTYTLVVETGDARDSTPVEVRPDPLMPEIGPDDYRRREAFLVAVLRVESEAESLRGALRDREGALPRERIEAHRTSLDRTRAQARRLYSGLEGGGARPGSLEPPTPEHEALLGELRERLRRVRTDLEAGVPGGGVL